MGMLIVGMWLGAVVALGGCGLAFWLLFIRDCPDAPDWAETDSQKITGAGA